MAVVWMPPAIVQPAIVETFNSPEIWADGGIVRFDGDTVHVLMWARQMQRRGEVKLIEAGRVRMPLTGYMWSMDLAITQITDGRSRH